MTAEFIAPDIHCDKCASRVKQALSPRAGVRSVNVDPARHAVKIDFDETKTTSQSLEQTLVEAGYPPRK